MVKCLLVGCVSILLDKYNNQYLGYIGNTVVTKNQDIDMMVKKLHLISKPLSTSYFIRNCPQKSSDSALCADTNSLGYVYGS